MTLHEQQSKFAQDMAKLILYIHEKGYRCTMGETFRTQAQAEINFKRGTGIKNSLHCKRLAVDLNLFNSKGKYLMFTEDHEPFGKYWESLDPMNKWGGHFTGDLVDGNHYERKEIIKETKND